MAQTDEGVRPPSRDRARAGGRVPWIVCLLVAGALGWAGCRAETGDEAAAPSRWRGVPLEQPEPKPDFVLADTEGRPFDFRAETDGRMTLLLFGYTSCPDVCPVHLAQLAEVLGRYPELRRQVEVVFVGVDAARDTPERVRSFLDRFDERFVGLVGTPAELEAAQRAAGVPPAFVDQEWEGGYSVSHAGWILAYTADGMARLRYPFGTRQIDWEHDLRLLLAERTVPGQAPAGAAAPAVEAGALVIRDARIPEPASDVAALYLRVRNRDGTGDRLQSAATPVARRTMLHRTVNESGRASMRLASDGIPVPARGEVRLEPGGYHVMLSGLTQPLVRGMEVEVVLVFERAGTLRLRAPVVPPAAALDSHHAAHAHP